MSVFDRFTRVLEDAAPEFLFEISDAGISFARHSAPGNIGFQPLDPAVLTISPLQDNVLRPDLFAQQVRSIVPPSNSKKRRKAVVILPDYCARLTVLDFDTFPKDAAEQDSLVRFRVKKTVPFDVDSAAVSYHVQQRANDDGKKLDVVVLMRQCSHTLNHFSNMPY